MATEGLFLGTTFRRYLHEVYGDDDGIAKYVEDTLHPMIGSGVKADATHKKRNYSACMRMAIEKVVFGVEQHCDRYGINCCRSDCPADDPTPAGVAAQCFKPTCVRSMGPDKLEFLAESCATRSIGWDVVDPRHAAAQPKMLRLNLADVLRESARLPPPREYEELTSITCEPIPSDEETFEQVLETIAAERFKKLEKRVKVLEMEMSRMTNPAGPREGASAPKRRRKGRKDPDTEL